MGNYCNYFTRISLPKARIREKFQRDKNPLSTVASHCCHLVVQSGKNICLLDLTIGEAENIFKKIVDFFFPEISN